MQPQLMLNDYHQMPKKMPKKIKRKRIDDEDAQVYKRLTDCIKHDSPKTKKQLLNTAIDFETNELCEMYYDEHTRKLQKDKILLRLFKINEARIKSIISRYVTLGTTCDHEDLYQISFEATMSALNDYRNDKFKEEIAASNMTFAVFLQWRVQRYFQNNNKGKDKTVDIYDANGTYTETMDYAKYKYKKAQIQADGYTGVIRSRTVYLDDMDTEPTPNSNINHTEETLLDTLDMKFRIERSRANN